MIMWDMTLKWINQFYIYAYIYREMVDFGKSDKIIKISEKVHKLNTYNGFSGEVLPWIKNQISLLNPL